MSMDPMAVKRPRLDEAGAPASTPLLAQEATSASASGSSAIAAARVDDVQGNGMEEKATVAASQGPARGVESTTMAFPEELPMEYEYKQPAFYVRECYPQYYKMILRLLYTGDSTRDMKIVTVTGTPGIGKSIFFAYFFSRYSLEYPAATVITASFAKQGDMSKMKVVVVWKGGKVVGRAAVLESAMIDLMLKAQQEATGRVIHLYDGPPIISPPDVQVVCFTSPNKSWFGQIRKSQYRPKVFMPLWDLEELRTAAEELDLTMNAPREDDGIFDPEGELSTATQEPEDVLMVADQVEQRFKIFGGVARECLSTKAAFVRAHQRDIEEIVKKYDKIEHVQCLFNKTEAELTHHCVCHYVPNPRNVTEYTIAAPSKFVERLVVECLNKLVTAKRKKIIGYLQASSAAASFRGALFEVGVHEQLSSKCEFTARRLGGGDTTRLDKFKCAKSVPTQQGESYCFFDSDFSALVLSSGPYHVPRAKNFVSINSFYYPTPRHSFASKSSTNDQGPLWLFQITVAQTHPVSGEGVAHVLERLGLLEMARAHPERVALIFVVPKENAPRFERQEIELEISNDEDSVRKLNKIGKTRESSLNAVGIYKIGDLRKRLDDAEATKRGAPTQQTILPNRLPLGLLRMLLSEHDKQQQRPWLKNVLDSIPQFVWGVELDPQYSMSP